MKDKKNIIILDEKLAEAINLFEFDKFNANDKRKNLNYSIDFPVLISNVNNTITNLTGYGRLTEPVFNNIVKNEEKYCSLYLKNINKSYFTNRLVSEISNSYGFGFKRKIDVFTPNIFQKLMNIFIKKFGEVIQNPTAYELEMIARKRNLPVSEVKWLFKQIEKIGVDKIMKDGIDLESAEESLNLNDIFPNEAKFISIMRKLLDVESIDVEIYYEYFKRIFSDLYFEIHPNDSLSTNLNNDQKEIYITYLKLLTLRLYEYFDILKMVLVDERYINKFSTLLVQIEHEIKFLETNLL